MTHRCRTVAIDGLRLHIYLESVSDRDAAKHAKISQEAWTMWRRKHGLRAKNRRLLRENVESRLVIEMPKKRKE